MQRSKMKMSQRAKIFAPYDALKGFKELIHDKEKIKEERIILSSEMEEELNERLNFLVTGDMIKIKYYSEPCECYLEFQGIFRKIDEINKKIIIVKSEFNIKDIIQINVILDK